MDVVLICASGAVMGVLVGVIIKKISPDIGKALSLFISASVAVCALGCFATVKDFVSELLRHTALPHECGDTVMRICGVGIISRLSSDLCRTAGDEGIADAMDMLGTGAAAVCSLPLWQSVAEILLSFTG
ncbi:MAG: hypothetical protein IJY86_06090 [Clostridia bacterium]|nr:hypothetical protein [Clostridia bacterium]